MAKKIQKKVWGEFEAEKQAVAGRLSDCRIEHLLETMTDFDLGAVPAGPGDYLELGVGFGSNK